MAFFSTGPKIRLSVMTLSSSSRGFVVLRGYTLFSVTGNPERLERAKRFVIDGLTAGNFRPLIARCFPVKEIVEAHRYLESNQQVGKIVVTI